MGIHGHPWASMGIHGHPWASMGIHGHPWASMGIHGHPWASMGIHGHPWASMGYAAMFALHHASKQQLMLSAVASCGRETEYGYYRLPTPKVLEVVLEISMISPSLLPIILGWIQPSLFRPILSPSETSLIRVAIVVGWDIVAKSLPHHLLCRISGGTGAGRSEAQLRPSLPWGAGKGRCGAMVDGPRKAKNIQKTTVPCTASLKPNMEKWRDQPISSASELWGRNHELNSGLTMISLIRFRGDVLGSAQSWSFVWFCIVLHRADFVVTSAMWICGPRCLCFRNLLHFLAQALCKVHRCSHQAFDTNAVSLIATGKTQRFRSSNLGMV